MNECHIGKTDESENVTQIGFLKIELLSLSALGIGAASRRDDKHFLVLNKNLENLAFFAAFGRSSNWAAGAAVAVGMGKPAFCAGFQAPRRGVGTRHETTINTPSERHFHSESLDFQGFGKIL